MKKLLLATIGLMGALTAAYAAPKASDVLYVGKFDGRGVSADEAAMVESSVCTAASQDGRFNVRCRDTSKSVAELRQLQAELGFKEGQAGADDCGKDGCIGALSAAGDAKWALVGSLSKVAEKQYLLQIQVVDPKTMTQITRVEEKIAGDMGAVIDRIPGSVRKALTPPQKK